MVDVLQKMAKQRRESITLYEQGGRQELAEVEKGHRGAAGRLEQAHLSESARAEEEATRHRMFVLQYIAYCLL